MTSWSVNCFINKGSKSSERCAPCSELVRAAVCSLLLSDQECFVSETNWKQQIFTWQKCKLNTLYCNLSVSLKTRHQHILLLISWFLNQLIVWTLMFIVTSADWSCAKWFVPGQAKSSPPLWGVISFPLPGKRRVCRVWSHKKQSEVTFWTCGWLLSSFHLWSSFVYYIYTWLRWSSHDISPITSRCGVPFLLVF